MDLKNKNLILCCSLLFLCLFFFSNADVINAQTTGYENGAWCGTAAQGQWSSLSWTSGCLCATGYQMSSLVDFADNKFWNPTAAKYYWTWTCGQFDANGFVVVGTNRSCSAWYKATGPAGGCVSGPQAGQCGTANRTYAYSESAWGSYTFCSVGTPNPASPAFPAGGSSRTWTCSGVNGGAVSGTCTATHSNARPGVCGTANRTYAQSETGWGSYSFCNPGSPNPGSLSFPAAGSSTTWVCNGLSGGTASGTCTAKHAKNGQCGTASGVNFTQSSTAWGTYTQCASGTPSSTLFPSVGASRTWTCSGTNGGTASGNCVAYHSQNGTCGSANRTYAYADTGWGSYTFCGIGTASPAGPTFPAVGNSTTWVCNGVYGGTASGNCTAIHSSTRNGACGTANGRTYLQADTAWGTYTQCSVGTPSTTTFPAAGSSTTWTCSGVAGGSQSGNCTANHAKNGVCGTASGKTYASSATAYSPDVQCSSGTSSNTAFPAQNSSITWTCSGTNGGTASGNCTASRSAPVVNGQCGTASGKTYSSSVTAYAPDTQCSAGNSTNAAFPAQGGSVTWVCNGVNGGTNSGTCSASRSSPPGSCGTAHTHGYYSTADIDTAAERCSAGTFTSFTDNGSSWSWGCSGGGTTTCTANKVACGTYHNTTRRDQPATNLCQYGTNTTVSLTGNSWLWNCTNSPGTNAGCFTYKTTCGTSNGATLPSAPATNLCATNGGNASAVTTGSTNYTWTCTGSDGLAVSCSANKSAPIVNGVCGTAHTHGYYSTADIDTAAERCSAGTFTSFTDNGSSWGWSCNGSGGGTSATCNANKVACGTYHNTIRRDQPATNLCQYGTNTAVSLAGTSWLWSCTNNPGTDAGCFTYKTTCGSAAGGTYSSPPVSNLCATNGGNASAVTTNTGTYTWTCTGEDNLAVSCTANRSNNGVCGNASGKTYASNITAYAPDLQCSAGNSTNTTFPAQNSSVIWVCSGINGGTNSPNCTASRSAAPINGTCGSAKDKTYAASATAYAPDVQCSLGTSTNTAFPAQGGSATWVCNGANGGTNSSSCTAYREAVVTCGEANARVFTNMPTTNLCSDGSGAPPIIVTGTGTASDPWEWTCGSDSCSAAKVNLPSWHEGGN